MGVKSVVRDLNFWASLKDTLSAYEARQRKLEAEVRKLVDQNRQLVMHLKYKEKESADMRDSIKRIEDMLMQKGLPRPPDEE